jgi:hypothetical protein
MYNRFLCKYVTKIGLQFVPMNFHTDAFFQAWGNLRKYLAKDKVLKEEGKGLSVRGGEVDGGMVVGIVRFICERGQVGQNRESCPQNGIRGPELSTTNNEFHGNYDI